MLCSPIEALFERGYRRLRTPRCVRPVDKTLFSTCHAWIGARRAPDLSTGHGRWYGKEKVVGRLDMHILYLRLPKGVQ